MLGWDSNAFSHICLLKIHVVFKEVQKSDLNSAKDEQFQTVNDTTKYLHFVICNLTQPLSSFIAGLFPIDIIFGIRNHQIIHRGQEIQVSSLICSYQKYYEEKKLSVATLR